MSSTMPSAIRCGWAANNWRTCSVILTEEPEATALGTAVCAAAGAGLYADVVEASEQMVTVTRQIDPNPNNAEVYDTLFDRYVRTYPCLVDLMHESAGDET